MSTQKYKNRDIRKLTRLGNRSVAVTLPIELVEELRWKPHHKVRVVKKGRGLYIKDWK